MSLFGKQVEKGEGVRGGFLKWGGGGGGGGQNATPLGVDDT